MIYTQGKGIVATAAELKALLVFTDAESVVDFIVRDGFFVARAGNPHTVHHAVEVWSEKGKLPEELAWQFEAATLKRIAKIAGKDEEIFFPVAKSGHISRYRIRAIDCDDTTTANHEGSLDGHVTHQTLVPMGVVPELPTEIADSDVWSQVDPAALAKLNTIAKAVGNGRLRMFPIDSFQGRTCVAIDTARRFNDEEPPRWVVSLAYDHFAPEERDGETRDDRQERLELGDDAEAAE